MLDNRLLKSILLKLMAYYTLLVIVGFVFEQTLLVLLIGSIVILLVNIKEFVEVVKWIWQSPKKRNIHINSHWSYIYYGIEKSLKANRKRRKQLIGSLGQFREGADALPEGIVVFNQHNAILWCNLAARDFLGLKWPLDQGQRLDNLIRHPEFSQYLIERNFDKVLLLPSPVNEESLLEYRIIGYGLDQYLLVSRDITKVFRLEQMRREFVANVSHELKTPLTVLQGYLELFDDYDSSDNPGWGKATNAMKLQTQRMQAMVEQLLSLSTIEATSNLVNQKIMLNALMDMLKEDAAALIGERALTLHFDSAAGLNIHGDEAQIYSACSNLVCNAIRYSPDGSSIKVRWRKVAKGAEFSVEDNGQGIAPQHIARLTERFYRVDQSRSSQTGGTGLGLSIVKHVLLNHQSALKITSKIGKGSRFSFVIDNDRI